MSGFEKHAADLDGLVQVITSDVAQPRPFTCRYLEDLNMDYFLSQFP